MAEERTIVTTITRGNAADHVTSVVKPDDFDEFWADLLRQAANTPLNETLEHIPLRSNEQVDTYEIHYDSIDNVRIAGWYCRPTEQYLQPPYPALLLAPGYISEPTLPKSWARMGYAAVGVAPRGKLRSNSQFNPGYPGLLTHNIVDLETYSYRSFYIDACRAVDFVQSRAEIDASRIGVQGGSQGGALTLTTAALRNDAITCGAAGAPYLTGFMDSASLTHSNPYQEMNDYLRLYPEREPDMRKTVAYFDCINFAPMIKASMLITVGLGDDVCPPETAFDLVNQISGPVELLAYPRCGHDAGGYWCTSRIESFLAGHLKPAKHEAAR